jgi:hypothetical protein
VVYYRGRRALPLGNVSDALARRPAPKAKALRSAGRDGGRPGRTFQWWRRTTLW